VRRPPKRSGAIAAIGALVWGVLFTQAALGIDTTQTRGAPVAIRVFQSLSTFSAESRVSQTITFDDFETGASFGNPALLGSVDVFHSTAATFKTIGTPAYLSRVIAERTGSVQS
jgi:hypothetical protein